MDGDSSFILTNVDGSFDSIYAYFALYKNNDWTSTR